MSAEDSPATHEQWEQARQRRDSRARLSADSLLAGKPELALELAYKYKAEDNAMKWLEAQLDAQYDKEQTP